MCPALMFELYGDESKGKIKLNNDDMEIYLDIFQEKEIFNRFGNTL